ncbi:MAG: DUF4339 domain-containing protein [Bacteroidota bacterium]
MVEYYYVKDEQQFGPFSFEGLKNEKVKPTYLVWREGFDDWKIASEVEEIKELFKATPPPIPKAAAIKPKVKEEKKVTPPPVKPVISKPQPKRPVGLEPPIVKSLPPEAGQRNLIAFCMTTAFILFKLFIAYLLPDIVNLLITVAILLAIWFFIRQNVIDKEESFLAKRLFLIIGAIGAYGILNTIYVIGGKDLAGASIELHLQVAMGVMTVASILAIVGSVNFLSASRRLGGVNVMIGMTTLLAIPFFLYASTLGYMPTFEVFDDMVDGKDKLPFNLMFNFWYMAPYYFIAYQFFKNSKVK